MSRILFSEHQSFRQVIWIWLIVVPVVFISFLVVFYRFYQQVIEGQPMGNSSDHELIFSLVMVTVVHTLVIWLIASLRLDIEITKDEFRYKFFGFTGWKVLTRGQITGYSADKFSFWKVGGLGYHVNLLSKTVRVIIKPSNILTLTTSTGRTLIVSTENKEELERAMQKLMSTSENF